MSISKNTTISNNTLGDRLKTLRKNTGLSQKELADKIKIPVRTYASYERNERMMNTAVLCDICNILHTTTDYLIRGVDPAKNQQWIHNPENEVETFINDFMMHAIGKSAIEQKSTDDELAEHIRYHFRSGYCWHFAQMLKATFNRGIICWTAPFGHIVWYDNKTDDYYDIEGRYNGEARYMIPERYLGEYANAYRHISKEYDEKYSPKDKEILIKIMKHYCRTNQIEYDNSVEVYFI